jgi:hypothetical protein
LILRLSWTHDWVLAGPEMWRMDFHPDTIWIATWGNRPEALWAPLSYGAFFGFAIFFWLKYLEGPLRARLGPWRYLVPFPVIFLGNVVVEGSIIEWFHTNHYHQPHNWLVFNLPWLHFVTTGCMLTGILFFTVEALRVLEHFGWQDFEPASRPAAVPAGRIRAAMFAVGVALPQAGLTAATMVGLYLYDWVGIPLR